MVIIVRALRDWACDSFGSRCKNFVSYLIKDHPTGINGIMCTYLNEAIEPQEDIGAFNSLVFQANRQ